MYTKFRYTLSHPFLRSNTTLYTFIECFLYVDVVEFKLKIYVTIIMRAKRRNFQAKSHNKQLCSQEHKTFENALFEH